jgi:hypothetical protein
MGRQWVFDVRRSVETRYRGAESCQIVVAFDKVSVLGQNVTADVFPSG